MTAPEACSSMRELRKEIDAIDAELVALLAKRARYIDRATELKPAEGVPARIPARVDEVLANVEQLSVQAGLDPQLAVPLWTRIIDWSIAREEKVLGSGDNSKDHI